MPSDAYRRDVVKNMYPQSTRWKKKVDRMSGGQVLAIYNKQVNNPSKKDQNEDPPNIPF